MTENGKPLADLFSKHAAVPKTEIKFALKHAKTGMNIPYKKEGTATKCRPRFLRFKIDQAFLREPRRAGSPFALFLAEGEERRLFFLPERSASSSRFS